MLSKSVLVQVCPVKISYAPCYLAVCIIMQERYTNTESLLSYMYYIPAT